MKVTPVMGRPFAFYVQSRSGGEDRFVDWLNQPPTCTCPDWGMRQRTHFMETGKPYLCDHLTESREHCWNEILEHTREQTLSQ